MRELICPNCDTRLAPGEVAGGWCETCGKKIPRYVTSGALDVAPRGRPATTDRGPDEGRERHGRGAVAEPPPAAPAAPPRGKVAVGAAPATPRGEPAREALTADGAATAQPRPLRDPLRGFRLFLGWGLLLQLAVLSVPLGELATSDEPFWMVWLLQMLLVLPVTAFVWRVLPNRVTNAFYLRSFRNDRHTWPVRKAAQAALGRGFRLSGIRDPRRRWPPVLRILAFVIFVFRYSTPKFMNLEAGDDWKARLWRSLGDARCALIDLSDLTPFVEEEIHLSYRSLGPERVLFVGDPSRDRDAWKDLVARVLSLPDADRGAIQVVIWEDSAAGRRAFADGVKAFAAGLPAGTAGPRPEAFPLVRSAVLPEGAARAEDWSFWGQTLLGLLLASLLSVIYRTVLSADGWFALYWHYPLLALYAYVLLLALNYLVDCGSNRERALFATSLVLLLAWGGTLVRGGEKVREAADRALSANNLKRIGLALLEYQSDHNAFPEPAIHGENGMPLLSWRVAILPHLGEEENALYVRFRLNEPWDSEHNRKLLKEMPEVYAPPAGRAKGDHTTFYQVFVTPYGPFGNPPGAGAVFEGIPYPGYLYRFRPDKPPLPLTRVPPSRRKGIGWQGIPDGTSSTLLVVEAADPVPWTKPHDLPFLPPRWPPEAGEGPLPQLGGVFESGYHALFCDGAPRFIRRSVSEETLRGLIGRNDGMLIDRGELDR